MRFARFSVVPLVALAMAVAAFAQPPASTAPQMRVDGPPPAEKPFNITRSDSGLDAVIARNAKLETLATGFGLNEGAVWVNEGNSGYLLVSGLLDNVIYKITPDKKVSVFMERAGYTGTDVNHTGAQTRSGRSHVLLIADRNFEGPCSAGSGARNRHCVKAAGGSRR